MAMSITADLLHFALETAQILSVSVFEKTELSSAFRGDGLSDDLLDSANQLNLFGN